MDCLVKKKDKKVILLTGSSSGIGFALANLFSKEDFYLVVCSRNIKKLKQHFSKKKNVYVLKIDLRNEIEIKRNIKKIFKKFGKIDILINNAGICVVNKFEKIDKKKIDQTFKTNVYAPLFLIKECLPKMKKNNFGRIINISSGGSTNCSKFFTLYSASKAALNTFSKSLNHEISNYNIKINTLSPGPCKTKMFPKNPLSPDLCFSSVKKLIDIGKDGPSGKFFWFKKEIKIIPNLNINWARPKKV